jgi:hypothetical protein
VSDRSPANIGPLSDGERLREIAGTVGVVVVLIPLIGLAALVSVVCIVGGIAVALLWSDVTMFARLLGLATAALGGLLIWATIGVCQRRARAWLLRRWGIRTEATLTGVSHFLRDPDGDGWDLDYRYEVEGHELTGKAHQFSPPRAGGEWEAGRTVLIAYDRLRPASSVMM